MTNDIETARGLIGQVRARLRRSRVMRGVGLLVASIAAAAVVSFAFDFLLDLPVAVRGVHLLVTLAALAVFGAWAFRPLRRNPSDAVLAEAIEHDVPEFQDRLVSSLDFEARLADPAEPESRAMMAATVRETSEIAARIDASLLVDARPARVAIGLAACAVGAVVAMELLFPAETSLWFRRGLLLEDVSWPRRTNVVIEGFPAEGPLVVTRGDDLRIVARADGWQPADVDLHIEELADDGTDGVVADATGGKVTARDVRRMYAVPELPGKFAFDLRSVGASFRLWVTGGDDADERPTYLVRALLAPRVGAFEALVEPPAYTGIAARTEREPTFEALRGSKITLRFAANMPLASAQIRFTGGAQEAAVLGADRKSFSTSFDLTESREFHVDLRAGTGQVNRAEDDVFRVEAVADRAPTLRLLHPHGRIFATPEAVLPVKLLAEDDFGLATIDLDAQQAASAAWRESVWTRPAPAATPPQPPSAQPSAGIPAAPDAAADGRRVHVYRPLDLVAFKGDQGIHPRPGDVLTLSARARDVGGLESESRDVAVEIVSPEDLAQRMTNEMSRLRDDLSKARGVQRRALAAIREIQSAGAAADAAAVRRARDVQVDQGRVVNDTARFTTGVFRVFDTLVLARLGSIPTVDRLLPLYHRHLAAPPDDTGEVFPAALYAKILEEKRANRLYDPELIGILLDVMDLADRVRERDGPAAYDTLDAWAADEARTASRLADAYARARDLLATLDAIDERLQRFDDMSQILQLARAIREEQEKLRTKPQPTETK